MRVIQQTYLELGSMKFQVSVICRSAIFVANVHIIAYHVKSIFERIKCPENHCLSMPVQNTTNYIKEIKYYRWDKAIWIELHITLLVIQVL